MKRNGYLQPDNRAWSFVFIITNHTLEESWLTSADGHSQAWDMVEEYLPGGEYTIQETSKWWGKLKEPKE